MKKIKCDSCFHVFPSGESDTLDACEVEIISKCKTCEDEEREYVRFYTLNENTLA